MPPGNHTLALRISFDFTVEVVAGDSRGAFRLRGPAVQDRPGERFVYLRMGAYAGQASMIEGWRAKVSLEGAGPKGGPACATVPLGRGWYAVV